MFSVSWSVRRSRGLQRLFLLVASWYFYARLDPALFGLIFGSSFANWVVGEGIARARERGRSTRDLMWLGVLFNLGVLGFFKYWNFFRVELESFLGIFGLSSGLPLLEILLPLGLSFYTFQSISYLVDLHRGYGDRATHLVDYLLYIAFFPQLLIGPICRSRDLLPQLMGPAPNEVPDVSRAVSLIASGLFKKMVLATWLATHLVDETFTAPENYSSVELLVAAYGYSMMLYCDFSGYVDMARGLALLLGFHLPDNFAGPYAATSIAEFWRRWHITFSNWLRDYIYLPLGGSRRSKPRVYLNLFLTLLVAGAWHGAAWKFVLWGAAHGLALVAYKIVQDVRRARGTSRKPGEFPFWYRGLGWFYTLNLCVFLRIIFYTADLEVGLMYFKGLFAFTLYGRGFEWLALPIIALVLFMNFYGRQMREQFIRAHEALPRAARPIAWVALAVALSALKPADVAPYVYFAF